MFIMQRKSEKQEFMDFLTESKQQVDKIVEEFNHHSREFDRRVSKILASL